MFTIVKEDMLDSHLDSASIISKLPNSRIRQKKEEEEDWRVCIAISHALRFRFYINLSLSRSHVCLFLFEEDCLDDKMKRASASAQLLPLRKTLCVFSLSENKYNSIPFNSC